MDQKPLVHKICLLKKFPGKGGWTYTELPEVPPNKDNPFGWVKVKGMIDDYELKQYKLMPMGNGQLFLPVKAQIRKKIKKEAGDHVEVILYADDDPLVIPEEIIDCFADEPPKRYQSFLQFSEGEQKAYLDWIYAAKTEETKANRILEMMERLRKSLRLQDKNDKAENK
ncbi:MAG: YdeI/OmpD-associated family protein [Bacteroidota bacterium]